MDLFSATFAGFRRYADTWINLDAPTIAVVGPNEAGKSSLLRALVIAGTDDPVPDADITRGLVLPPNAELVRLRFRIRPEELEVHHPEAAGRWLFVSKRRDGPRELRIEPPLERDLTARKAFIRALDTLTGRRWYERLVTGTSYEATALDLLEAIQTDEQTLPDDVLSRLAEFRGFVLEGLGEDSRRQDVQRVVKAIDSTIAIESEPHPNDVALEVLKAKVPTFLEFDEASRNLRSTYNLQEPNDFKAVALRNIASTAGLGLRALRDAITGGNTGLAKSIIEQANERLRVVLQEAWHQSDLEVWFDHEGPVLQILARTNRRDFFFLEDRSDGLRTFISLHAFAHRGLAARPVLLVDEAEVHLHYDAQSDLVGVFESQELADRIIYTTHSAGCLPRDLGRSVRVVIADPEADRSEIKNQFWQLGAGAMPLIMSMGATTLAFAASRHAVFAEGASDHLLLPALMREVVGLESLPFQVLPGLASTGSGSIAELQLGASRSAFVVDGDAGGESKRQSLLASGIDPRRIVMLGRRNTSRLQLEDLLDLKILCSAINEEIRRWSNVPLPEILPGDLPRRSRSAAIDAWCETNGATPPSRPAIAVRILALMQAGDEFTRVTDAGHATYIRDLFEGCMRALDIPS